MLHAAIMMFTIIPLKSNTFIILFFCYLGLFIHNRQHFTAYLWCSSWQSKSRVITTWNSRNCDPEWLDALFNFLCVCVLWAFAAISYLLKLQFVWPLRSTNWAKLILTGPPTVPHQIQFLTKGQPDLRAWKMKPVPKTAFPLVAKSESGPLMPMWNSAAEISMCRDCCGLASLHLYKWLIYI